MKKNKLFIILIITIAALVFTTAQVCNLCGISPAQETNEDVADETSSETTARETTADTTVATISKDPEEPTIELNVYMGPEYNAADDVCFYRVEAIVTGNPMPTEAVFSKDDSGGSWGPLRAQVNLTRAEPDYILTSTVTTSAGTDEASIDLSWGCDGEEPEPEPDPEELEDLHPIVFQGHANDALSGFITDDAEVTTGAGMVHIGDNIDDNQIKGYISFGISGWEGTVEGCSIGILVLELIRNPEAIGDTLNIKYLEYDTLDASDFDLEGELIYSMPIAGLDSLIIPNEALLDTFQRAVDDPTINNYQLELSINGDTNPDGRSDLISFDTIAASFGGTIYN